VGGGAWALTALAAIAAMEFGRQLLWALSLSGVASDQAVLTAGNRAAEWFRAALQDLGGGVPDTA
jgi:hypothetical protein